MTKAIFALTEDKARNRRILSNGLTSPKCVYAGAARPIDYQDAGDFLPAACRLGSVEEYAQGEKNMFVRIIEAGSAHAVIVLR